ncbi:TetR/AcrR family transcriptional regulator [Actinophytocola sp.]|uniref:TetR/AcrR family transcriptional regulator n=1 Tax=Actinophytocola sp. TaxID=1872138 RepID=UPI003899BEEB
MRRNHEDDQETRFQRARRPEQKRQRQAAILEAALRLAKRDGIRNISLADIAGEVGMHKTALLRYFETREDIYLHLAIDAWRDWADTLGAELKSLATGDVQGVATAIGRTLEQRPFLCDVFTHSPLNLERNVSVQTLLGFKLAAHTAVTALANAVQLVLPDLSQADCTEVVGAVTAIAAVLTQSIHPPPTVAQLYAEHPQLAFPYNDFAATITRLAETLVLGMRARNAMPHNT